MVDLKAYGWDLETIGEVDHHIVKAPYIRLVECRPINRAEDCICLYDLRFTQPNNNYINPKTLHSMEHFFLVGLKKYTDSFFSVAPMGCQTGLYLIFINEVNANKITFYLEKVLQDINDAIEVPLNNTKNCGQAFYHDLEGAKQLAKQMLKHKDNWLNVYKK